MGFPKSFFENKFPFFELFDIILLVSEVNRKVIFDNKKLSDLLDENEMRQIQLAKEIKRSKSTVCEYIKGTKSPGKEAAFAISRVFSIPVEDLFKRVE
ncbi:helix-turn-helix domain-containing protein [Bacillus paramobilis]|uniref:helix-turn-helix transcriptional regulator n=1 Tax=Bacillus paramobilis TaxID=2817477 RepID=UPI0020C9F651